MGNFIWGIVVGGIGVSVLWWLFWRKNKDKMNSLLETVTKEGGELSEDLKGKISGLLKKKK